MAERPDAHYTQSSSSNPRPNNQQHQNNNVPSETTAVEENRDLDEQQPAPMPIHRSDSSGHVGQMHDRYVIQNLVMEKKDPTESSNHNPNEQSSSLLPTYQKEHRHHHHVGSTEVNLSSVECSSETQPTDHHNDPSKTNEIKSNTVVVQVPKDQVYRVPPPENAIIVERHRTVLDQKKKPRSCYSRCLCCLLWISIIIVLGVIAGVMFIFLRPKGS